MIPRLGCLFVIVPLIELALLIQVGRWIGVWPTVALVALTGLAGAFLVRAEGLRTLARVQLELGRGRLPGRALADGASLLMAGAFLMTPGVLTDAAAFALLFVPTRRLIQGWVLARVGRAVKRGTIHVQMRGFERMGGWWGREGAGEEGVAEVQGEPGYGSESGPDEGAEKGLDDGFGRKGHDGRDDDEGPRRGPRPGEIVQD